MKAAAAVVLLLLASCTAEYEAPRGDLKVKTTCMGTLPGDVSVMYEWFVYELATTTIAAVVTPTEAWMQKRAPEPYGQGIWDNGSWLLRPMAGRLEAFSPGGASPDGVPLGKLVGTVPCVVETY